jgi:hypothetical protein
MSYAGGSCWMLTGTVRRVTLPSVSCRCSAGSVDRRGEELMPSPGAEGGASHLSASGGFTPPRALTMISA